MTNEAPRKPWYLVVALLACWIGFGGCGLANAWEGVERYRGVQFEQPAADLTREDDRAAATAAYNRWTAAVEAERPRGFPLAVAELVLGLAMFIFASAAWLGRSGARRALVQVTLAQAALVIATFVVTPRSRAGQLDYTLELASRGAIEKGQPREQVEMSTRGARMFGGPASIAVLAIRTLVAVLVVVALTRPRALAYYEAMNERPNEG